MVVSGIVVELVSLAMCIAVGFVYATCSMTFLEEGEWPTDQMHSRGGERSIDCAVLKRRGQGRHFTTCVLHEEKRKAHNSRVSLG